MVGAVEKNISRERDSLANGGQILTVGCFMEMEDECEIKNNTKIRYRSIAGIWRIMVEQ